MFPAMDAAHAQSVGTDASRVRTSSTIAKLLGAKKDSPGSENDPFGVGKGLSFKMTKVKRAKMKAKSKHGGARRGAGGPRSRIPADVIARLGECPTNPREIRIWFARMLVELTKLAMKGEVDSGLAATLRATAGAVERMLPPEPAPRHAEDDVDDVDEDDVEGPELEQVDEDYSGALRVG
ncbi:MAG: hypothetical protein AB7O24_26110 [Kofleriaceae bacterium]